MSQHIPQHKVIQERLNQVKRRLNLEGRLSTEIENVRKNMRETVTTGLPELKALGLTSKHAKLVKRRLDAENAKQEQLEGEKSNG